MTQPPVTQVGERIKSTAVAAARVRQAAREAADQAVADREAAETPPPAPAEPEA